MRSSDSLSVAGGIGCAGGGCGFGACVGGASSSAGDGFCLAAAAAVDGRGGRLAIGGLAFIAGLAVGLADCGLPTERAAATGSRDDDEVESPVVEVLGIL